MGNTLRSLAGPSAIDTALKLVRQQRRRFLAEGGVPQSPKRAKPDLAPRDLVLPLDVAAEEVRKAIKAKLGGASLHPNEALPLMERRAGGRVAVSAHYLLRLRAGRFDEGDNLCTVSSA